MSWPPWDPSRRPTPWPSSTQSERCSWPSRSSGPSCGATRSCTSVVPGWRSATARARTTWPTPSGSSRSSPGRASRSGPVSTRPARPTARGGSTRRSGTSSTASGFAKGTDFFSGGYRLALTGPPSASVAGSGAKPRASSDPFCRQMVSRASWSRSRAACWPVRWRGEASTTARRSWWRWLAVPPPGPMSAASSDRSPSPRWRPAGSRKVRRPRRAGRASPGQRGRRGRPHHRRRAHPLPAVGRPGRARRGRGARAVGQRPPGGLARRSRVVAQAGRAVRGGAGAAQRRRTRRIVQGRRAPARAGRGRHAPRRGRRPGYRVASADE